jgi:hypothetical protein
MEDGSIYGGNDVGLGPIGCPTLTDSCRCVQGNHRIPPGRASIIACLYRGASAEQNKWTLGSSGKVHYIPHWQLACCFALRLAQLRLLGIETDPN